MTDGRNPPDGHDERTARSDGPERAPDDDGYVGAEPGGDRRSEEYASFETPRDEYASAGEERGANDFDRRPVEPPMGRGPVFRNFLVAAATVPFVFLLVLIASIFVLGGGDEIAEPVRAPSITIALEEEPENKVVDRSLAGGEANASTQGSNERAPASAASIMIPDDAANFAINLPIDGEIRSVGLDGDRVALLVDGTEGPMVIVYDVLQGRALAQLPIASNEKARPSAANLSDSLSDDAAPQTELTIAAKAEPSRPDRRVDTSEEEYVDVAAAQAPTLKSVALTVERARREFEGIDEVAEQPTEIERVRPSSELDSL